MKALIAMLDFRGITFQWPLMLWLMLLLPLFVLAFWRMRGHQVDVAKRYPGLAVTSQNRGWARFWGVLAPLLLLLGLAALIAGIARPQALLALPQKQLDLMLAIDTSGSMRATDLAPNRLAAAQEIARKFIDGLPAHVRMGLVSVAATASLAQSPTKDREALRQAIDRLDAQRGTALGSGIVISLATLRPDADIDVEKLTTGRSSRQWFKDPTKSEKRDLEPVEAGSNKNMAIILMSDGKPTLGPEPKEAAKLAADLGIRVYTVGIGTTQGATLKVDGMNMKVRLEEQALQDIAKATMAEYYEASRPADLNKIFQSLNARLTLEKPRQTEITSLFVALGALLVIFGGMLSIFRHQRVL